MSATEIILNGLGGAGIFGFIAGLFYVRSKNRRINAEASNLDARNIKIFTESTNALLEPLTRQLNVATKRVEELEAQVAKLTAEVQQQRQIIRSNSVDLAAANRRADYYKQAFEGKADGA